MTLHAGVELTLELAPRLAPALAARIDGLGERAPADLSYGNLWLFRRPHAYRFHDGEWPCISGVAYDGQRHALPLFDPAQAPTPVLRELSERHGSLFPLTGREKPALEARGFRITENRDDADYVFPADQFRHYRGRGLHEKRRLMAQLEAAHAMVTLPYEPGLQPQALAVLEGWLQDKGKQAGEADDAACREALAQAGRLRLEGFVHLADGEPAGFLLAEELQPGVWVIRFAKGMARFAGIAQFMFHHFAHSAPRPVAWMNFEQDLGLANFRRTKLSYRPALMLPKWRASQLPQDR